jgi:hypothetical protein
MNESNVRLGGEKLFVWALIFLGAIVSILTGFMIGAYAIPMFVVIVAIALLITWIAGARERWWLLVPAAGTLGGYFYYGYKIYPHEVALLACFVPLAMAFAVRAPIAQLRTTAFPITMYLLGFYLVAHWIGSNVYNSTGGAAGYGNVSRAYFNAFWVILFLFAFWRWGSTKYIGAALLLCYLAAFARVIMGVLIYFTDAFAYVPVINYILPGSTHSRGDDLRASGLSLATLAMCYFLLKKGVFKKAFHTFVLLGSCVAVLLGSGRTVVVLAGIMPLFVALLYRKVLPLILTCIAVAGFLVVINSDPGILNPLPWRVQRSLSILLLNKGEAASYGRGTEASDEWHAGLRRVGYSKWTQSWQTVLFGTGIRPFDTAMQELRPGLNMSMEESLSISSGVGAYESGWWTVTAVTGVVGLVLYASVLLYLLRKLLPVLLRERVSDHSHAFALMAVFGIIIWIGLGWTNGSFPTTEIMFGFLALAALEDRKRETQPEHLSIMSQPLGRPSLAAT